MAISNQIRTKLISLSDLYFQGPATALRDTQGIVFANQPDIDRQEFGRRLYNFMMQNRMSQSDLSRASGMGRDSISQYVRGRSVPSPKNLTKLADALNVEVDVLFPNYDAQANAAEQPTFEMKSIESDAENFWLRINMKVPAEKALAVLQILKG
jgi:transcriptional regulator with XRE-family HTH domain